MQLPGFVGGSNITQSSLFDCESSINLRQESGQMNGKTQKYLQRTPGLRFLFSIGTQPTQGLFTLDERAFGISGEQFFEMFNDDTYVVWGTVEAPTEDFPIATICSNGSAGGQLFITAGGNGYTFDLTTNTGPTLIADVDFPNGDALMGEFFAGYFFVLLRNTREVRWSDLEDGTAWDPLDVFQRSWAADNISFMKRLGTHIWLVGTQTSEVLYATGGVDVFAPAQESLIEHGSVASFSGVRVDTPNGEALAWLDRSERGGGLAVIAKGLTAESISTYANARFEQLRHGVLNEAIGLAIQMDGHVDYVLNNVDDHFDRTPVFDLAEQQWHDRAHWNSTLCVWEPWRPQCHMYAFERHFVGDSLTGAVYELSMINTTDELAAA